jgi:hypothetical protein
MEAALANYREQIALYDFAAAKEAIKNVQLSGASLKQAQEATEKRAQWLIDWKNNLIDDINRAHFSGAISDSTGAKYTGIAGATDQSLSLKLPLRHRASYVERTFARDPARGLYFIR